MRSGSIDCQVLLLDEVDSEDGFVPGQSSEYIHRPPDLPPLEVQVAVESSYDLDWMSAS